MVAGSRRADVEILLRVSRMYYEQGLMQSEIAARIGYSRPHVSRLLAQTRKRSTYFYKDKVEKTRAVQKLIEGLMMKYYWTEVLRWNL